MTKRHNVNNKTPEEMTDTASYSAVMKDDSSNEAIGLRLGAARRAANLTQNAVARMLGVDQSTLGHWERGRGNPGYQQARKLESILKVSAEWLIYGRGPTPDIATPPPEEMPHARPATPDNAAQTKKSEVDFSKATPLVAGNKDLPVFGSVRGGFDGAEIDYHYPVEYIERPDILKGVKSACACFVVNDSMEPRYFAGERVLVHPGRPIRSGDFVVVELHDHKGIIKRFVRITDAYVELEQYNPPKKERVMRADVVGIHKVVGTLND